MLIVAYNIIIFLILFVMLGTNSASLGFLSLVIYVAFIAINIFCMWKAYKLEEYKLPVVGDWVMNLTRKIYQNN